MTSKGHTRGAGGGSYGGGSQEQEFGAQSTSRMQNSPPRHISSSSYLNTPSNLYRNSRSLDSGLDEFGAVPFTVSPLPQSRVGHVTHSQAEVIQVNLVAVVILDCPLSCTRKVGGPGIRSLVTYITTA